MSMVRDIAQQLTPWQREEARDLMDKYTHDLDGNEVDGDYWVLMEAEFQKALDAFRRAGNNAAVAIAWRLVTTADDVPAELVQHQQDFWNIAVEAESEEQSAAISNIPEVIYDEMIAEIGRGEYAPVNATAFVIEFIRRVTEAQGTPLWAFLAARNRR